MWYCYTDSNTFYETKHESFESANIVTLGDAESKTHYATYKLAI